MTSILKADTIQDTDGNNIINENSNTITIGASGDTTNIIGTLQNNGAAVGGANTPAFMAYLSSDQVVSDNTFTKVQIDTEEFDTDNAFDNSTNYRFTPQTAGKYFFYATCCLRSTVNSTFKRGNLGFYKNGSALYGGVSELSNNYGVSQQVTITATFALNGSSDYVELFANVDEQGGGTPKLESDYNSSNRSTYFGAYKIIE